MEAKTLKIRFLIISFFLNGFNLMAQNNFISIKNDTIYNLNDVVKIKTQLIETDKNKKTRLEEIYYDVYENKKFKKRIQEILKTFYENGQKKRMEEYDSLGNILIGKCFNKNGDEIKCYDYEIYPEFPGGDSLRIKYIKARQVFPEKVKKIVGKGFVEVKFTIMENGTIKNPIIIKSLHPKIDKNVVEIIKNMPKWSPYIKDSIPQEIEFSFGIDYQ